MSSSDESSATGESGSDGSGDSPKQPRDGALRRIAGSSSEEGSSLDEPSWVSWFCMLRKHEFFSWFFCEVDPAFVQDKPSRP